MKFKRKHLIFWVIQIALTLVVIEAVSFFFWKKHDISVARDLVLANTGGEFFRPFRKPNAFWHHEHNSQSTTVQTFLNSKGTKGPDFELQKPPGQLRVICIGDSTVEGLKHQPPQTFPGYLEERLKSLVDEHSAFDDVRVINAGIAGHNSAFSLAYLQLRLIHFDPDVVIIRSSFNDVNAFVIPGMGVDYTHIYPEPYVMQYPKGILWTLARHSYFFKVIAQRVIRVDQDGPFNNINGQFDPMVLLDMDYSQNEDKLFVYAENIRSMILACQGRGITPYVLSLETSANPEYYEQGRKMSDRYRTVVELLSREAERVADEEGVTFIKTGPYEDVDYYDHCHHTHSGHQKTADQVFDVLRADLL